MRKAHLNTTSLHYFAGPPRMYFDSDMSKLMQRYVGQQITVQTHGYSRIIGYLASVHESCIRLRNVVRLHELEDSRWYGEIERQQQEELETGDAETLIATHAITCVSCSEYPGDPEEEKPAVEDAIDPPHGDAESESLDDSVAIANLFIGAGLTTLLANDRSDLDRIRLLRRDIRSQMGFTMPKVRVQDDLTLPTNGYRFVIGGTQCASGEVQLGKLLAIQPEDAVLPSEGEHTVEPVFGLPATWIEKTAREEAEAAGCTVVDSWTIIVTHMGEAIRQNASSLLSYEETTRLLQSLREAFPSLVNDHFTDPDSVLRLHRVFCELLDDGLTLGNSERIATAVAQAKRMKEDQAMSHVRRAILVQLQASARDHSDELNAVGVSPESQKRLASSDIGVSQAEAERLCREIDAQVQPIVAKGGRLVVVVDAELFPIARRCLSFANHGCLVVSSIEARAMRGVAFVGLIGEVDDMVEPQDRLPGGRLAKPR